MTSGMIRDKSRRPFKRQLFACRKTGDSSWKAEGKTLRRVRISEHGGNRVTELLAEAQRSMNAYETHFHGHGQ